MAVVETPSRFQLALNSPGKGLLTPRSSKKKGHLELTEKVKQERTRRLVEGGSLDAKASGHPAREFVVEVGSIRSADELHLDLRQALSVKRGDLAIIQGEAFRCVPRAPHLRGIPLVVKKLECVDRKTYDLKLFEMDTFARFQGHANILSLYSFWNEKPTSPYVYKNLVLLLEEGLLGDLYSTIIRGGVKKSTGGGSLSTGEAVEEEEEEGEGEEDNAQRPYIGSRLALRYACDIARGLLAVHNCSIIHGRIKPSSIYLDGNGTAMIGEFGKVELDSARHTHQLFSKVLIGRAIPKTLVYWAPELLKLQRYGKEVDMWAFGVTLYQIYTGHHPFTVDDENAFRDEALLAAFDRDPIVGSNLAPIIDGCLRVNPDERWTASQVLNYAQTFFAVDVQRVYRGHRARISYRKSRDMLIMLQANVKGFIQYRRYKVYREEARNTMARRIQTNWRSHKQRKRFAQIRQVFLTCQANVKTKQQRAAYLRFKSSVLKCQTYCRRYLALKWVTRLKTKARELTSRCHDIQALLVETQDDILDMKEMMNADKLPNSLAHLEGFETYDRLRPLPGPVKALPELNWTRQRLAELEEESEKMRARIAELEEKEEKRAAEDKALREQLGPKYDELEPMMEEVKRRMARLASLCKESVPLPLSLLSPFPYSKWDTVHDKSNVVENVFEQSDDIFRQLSPTLDISLASGKVCFLSELEVESAEVGPAQVEVFVSSVMQNWSPLATFTFSKDRVNTFKIPGEQICKFLRLRFTHNVRGGAMIGIRRIKAKGVIKEDRRDVRALGVKGLVSMTSTSPSHSRSTTPTPAHPPTSNSASNANGGGGGEKGGVNDNDAAPTPIRPSPPSPAHLARPSPRVERWSPSPSHA